MFDVEGEREGEEGEVDILELGVSGIMCVVSWLGSGKE